LIRSCFIQYCSACPALYKYCTGTLLYCTVSSFMNRTPPNRQTDRLTDRHHRRTGMFSTLGFQSSPDLPLPTVLYCTVLHCQVLYCTHRSAESPTFDR
jgi:hypothetical protein